MGVWGIITSTTETIKNGSVATYGYCTSTASTLVRVVRVDALHQLYGYIPDGDRRSQITSVAGKFAKNAALYGFYEGYKLIPGGKAVGKIVFMTANDMKSENRQSNAEKRVPLKENIAMNSTAENSPIAASVLDRKPEDVLRVFMMKEFIGTRLLDDLIVPGAKKSK